jgi:hypothetical protein
MPNAQIETGTDKKKRRVLPLEEQYLVHTMMDWRKIPEKEKQDLARDVVEAIKSKREHRAIADHLGISCSLITRIAENNGVARKGNYKSKKNAITPVPYATNLDIPPHHSLLVDPSKLPKKYQPSELETPEVEPVEEDDSVGDANQPELSDYFEDVKCSDDDKSFIFDSEEPIVSFQDRLDFLCTNVVDFLNNNGFSVEGIKIKTTQGHVFVHKP